jgi:hypothetical protein
VLVYPRIYGVGGTLTRLTNRLARINAAVTAGAGCAMLGLIVTYALLLIEIFVAQRSIIPI